MPGRQLELTIKAIDQATSVLRDIRGQVTGVGEDVRETAPRFTELNQSLQLLREAYGALEGVYNETVGALITYTDEVSRLSSITGETPENVSRLLTVLGEFGVSSNDVIVAMRAMRDQGLTPTLETLGALSDQYLALEPGVERANALQEAFGRSGAEFVRVLELGSEGLAARAAAVEDGNVLTQQEIDQARLLETSLAGIHSSYTSLAITLAQTFAPALVGALGAVESLIGSIAAGISIVDQFNAALAGVGGVSGHGGVTVPITPGAISGHGGVVVPVHPLGHATGGPIGPVTEVGEEGTEGIINGIVVPHNQWEALKRMGLVPEVHAYRTDPGSGRGARVPYTSRNVMRAGVSNVPVSNIMESGLGNVGGGGGGGGAGGGMTAEIAALVAAVPTAAAIAAQEAGRAQAEETRKTGDAIITELQRVREEIERVNQTLPTMVADAVERAS